MSGRSRAAVVPQEGDHGSGEGRRADGAPTVGVLEMADGKVTCIYILANPEKLAHVGAPSSAAPS